MLPFERTTREELSASPRTVEGLVISPSRDSARPLVDFLRSEGVNVQVVNTPELGFEEALLHRPGIVIIEEGISKAGGVDLCARLKANARTHFLPVVVHFRGAPNDLFRLDALAAGADAIFSSETSKAERRARLWALLRSQAMFRRLDGKRQAQRTEISDKRRWVRGLVHDIQNSLSAIQANFDYVVMHSEVRNEKRKPDFEECVRDTRSTVHEMVRNLRTVLEFERFESGDVVLREDKVLLSDVSERVATGLRHLATSVHKSIVVDNTAYSVPIYGDSKYLTEAVSDLATYVLRQAENHECHLCASSADGVARLRIFGDRYEIPPPAREALFDPYAGPRKEKPARAAHRVGLALARIIVEAHQGTIEIQDTVGAGSAFVVEFPTHWRIRE